MVSLFVIGWQRSSCSSCLLLNLTRTQVNNRVEFIFTRLTFQEMRSSKCIGLVMKIYRRIKFNCLRRRNKCSEQFFI